MKARHTVDHQVMFKSIAHGSATRGDCNLAIDRGQVRVDRPRADHELFGYLLVRQSLGYQAQYLYFPGRKSSRIN